MTVVAGASNHVLYDAHGIVYACGGNDDGDLGDGSKRSTARPTKVAGLDGSLVTELVASFANSGALLSNGEYFDWGYDGNGQLGDGQFQPVIGRPGPGESPGSGYAGRSGGFYLGERADARDAGERLAMGLGQQLARAAGRRNDPVAGFSGAVLPARWGHLQSLATGAITSYAISTAGKVYAWGASPVGRSVTGHAVHLDPVRVASGAAMISSTANNVVVTIPGTT